MNFPYGPYLEVLEYLRQHPEGCTATQIGEAFPHLDADTRGGIIYRLRVSGFVLRTYGKRNVRVWVAIK